MKRLITIKLEKYKLQQASNFVTSKIEEKNQNDIYNRKIDYRVAFSIDIKDSFVTRTAA